MVDFNIQFCNMTPGAFALVKRLGCERVGDLAKLEADNIESLRSCVTAAQDLVDRYPNAADSPLVEPKDDR